MRCLKLVGSGDGVFVPGFMHPVVRERISIGIWRLGGRYPVVDLIVHRRSRVWLASRLSRQRLGRGATIAGSRIGWIDRPGHRKLRGQPVVDGGTGIGCTGVGQRRNLRAVSTESRLLHEIAMHPPV